MMKQSLYIYIAWLLKFQETVIRIFSHGHLDFLAFKRHRVIHFCANEAHIFLCFYTICSLLHIKMCFFVMKVYLVVVYLSTSSMPQDSVEVIIVLVCIRVLLFFVFLERSNKNKLVSVLLNVVVSLVCLMNKQLVKT